MKKILTLFAVVGLFAFSGCSNNDDNDTISYVFEVNKANFSPTSNSEIYVDFDSRIYSGDVILIYRYDGADPETKRDIWTPLPESHYYTDGKLYFTFKFDFTQDNFRIFTEGFDLNVNPIPADFVVDQIFRIVIVPGDDGFNTKKSVNVADYSDYNAVIKKYKIDDSNVKKLN
ncbi:hypothetical protein NJT12_10625 [Flavobacterium sp. AC]|uniref:Uncharacterized protein n=1 Tax=Flavobacterium azizsancarii TaxID=2961580 RepID=A0ABT4WBZ8_9FLAO|nr:hypothetical protein [Flavobacterium azizsancarii]MDA6070071.1 hypothetical protein [Flavobacterium azizsancarii]